MVAVSGVLFLVWVALKGNFQKYANFALTGNTAATMLDTAAAQQPLSNFTGGVGAFTAPPGTAP